MPMPEDLTCTAGLAGTMTSPTLPLAMPLLANPPGYELLEEIGHGGMGVVYRARDLALGRDVAIKILAGRHADDDTAALRFLTEARITGQLQHPSIPAVHQVGVLPNGRPFLAMKLIKGRTLEATLRTSAGASLERGPLLAIFEAVCQAMGYAHAHHVIHRDIKPSNIMVGAFGEVQVMDWGLAKILGEESSLGRNTPRVGAAPQAAPPEPPVPELATYTEAGCLIGTPAYIAPEQAAGEINKVDARADVFGLGALLAAVLTGKPPYVAASVEEVRLLAMLGQLGDCFARLEACGAEPELVALCRRCLAFEPKDRPADAGEVARTVAGLRAAAEDRARTAEREKAAADVRAQEQRRRRRWLYAAASVVLLTLVAGIAGTSWGLVRARAKEQEAQAARTIAERRLGQLERGNQLVTGIFTDLDLERVKLSDKPLEAELGERLAQAAAQLEGEAVGDPLTVATLQERLGVSLNSLGHAGPAAAALEKSLKTRQDHLGLDHPDTLGCMNNLAVSYEALGRHTEAFRLRAESLDRRKVTQGPDHPDTLRGMHDLAVSFSNLGRHTEALQLRTEALARRRARLGPDHPDTLWSMHNLAGSYASLGRNAEALKLNQEALALLKAKLGPDHPDTLWSMNNLALSYAAHGRHAEAFKLNEEALALRKAKLGPDHPATLASMNNLANSYAALGRKAEALQLREQTLVVLRAKHPSHLFTAICMSQLALSYATLSRHAEAIKLLEETLTLQKAKLGSDHPSTLVSMNNLAWLLATAPEEKLRDPSRAVALATQAVAAAPGNASYRGTLGTARYRAGDWQNAIADLEQVIKLRPVDDPASAEEGFFLAMAYWHLSEKEKARTWFTKSVAWMARGQQANPELQRFRAESAELLGVKETPASTSASQSPRPAP